MRNRKSFSPQACGPPAASRASRPQPRRSRGSAPAVFFLPPRSEPEAHRPSAGAGLCFPSCPHRGHQWPALLRSLPRWPGGSAPSTPARRDLLALHNSLSPAAVSGFTGRGLLAGEAAPWRGQQARVTGREASLPAAWARSGRGWLLTGPGACAGLCERRAGRGERWGPGVPRPGRAVGTRAAPGFPAASPEHLPAEAASGPGLAAQVLNQGGFVPRGHWTRLETFWWSRVGVLLAASGWRTGGPSGHRPRMPAVPRVRKPGSLLSHCMGEETEVQNQMLSPAVQSHCHLRRGVGGEESGGKPPPQGWRLGVEL